MFLVIGVFFPYKNFICPLVKKKRVKYKKKLEGDTITPAWK